MTATVQIEFFDRFFGRSQNHIAPLVGGADNQPVGIGILLDRRRFRGHARNLNGFKADFTQSGETAVDPAGRFEIVAQRVELRRDLSFFHDDFLLVSGY
ncbi:hypothetical protein SDC9_146625 [bioreactor metagenome]|uniref:Uncharacterized protein n=1 Tax=bioreactor metagenome TaxID=1076179 RepID=A0A645EBL1_9ZZZZ